MEVFDYIMANAKEIMYLCIGVGVLILSINVSRALVQLIQVLKKANRLTNNVEQLLWKPFQALKKANDTLSRFL